MTKQRGIVRPWVLALGGNEYALWIGFSRHPSSKDEPSQAT